MTYMNGLFGGARLYFVSTKRFMQMNLVAYKVILLVLYHVCKNFSNGATGMLLVLYYMHEDFSNGAKFMFYATIWHTEVIL